MGIPKFYRWVSERYPTIVQPIGDRAPQEFDSLLMDLNGVIHTCSHPYEDATRNTLPVELVAAGCFRFISKLVNIVRPTKLLYLAIDGVAPRAKMNQQRARRFRAARDAAEDVERLIAAGKEVPANIFDSNCISPGTVFMCEVAEHLRYFVARKQSEDPAWRSLRVVLSGHDVVGEGEHKIMSYLRSAQADPAWVPGRGHCLYGLDADLMILGLVTHEPNLAILREETLSAAVFKAKKRDVLAGPFQLVHLSVLRQYLALEFSQLQKKRDTERIIDDLVLIITMVGNDFVPGLPQLGIADKGLDTLLMQYKDLLAERSANMEHLTDGPEINWPMFSRFLQRLGDALSGGSLLQDISSLDGEGSFDNAELKFDGLDEPLAPEDDILTPGDISTSDMEPRGSRIENWEHDQYYTRRFGPESAPQNREWHRTLQESYLTGLSWVLHYYHGGCISWGWFYPYHYPPLVVDLSETARTLRPTMELGQPFTSLQQLLAVLPPNSAKLLPETYRWLMTDTKSPVIDFYPTQFRLDLDGKKHDWEALVLIPFIDTQRLLLAMAEAENRKPLTQADASRNIRGTDLVYTYSAVSFVLPTTLPSVFPGDFMCHSSPVALQPTPSPSRFHFTPGKEPLPCFPDLNVLPFTAMHKMAGVHVHSFRSRDISVVLKIADSALTMEEAAQRLLGRIVYVNYPYLTEAMVSAVVDMSSRISLRNGVPARAWHNATQQTDPTGWWAREVRSQSSDLLIRSAIDPGTIKVLVEVHPLDGLVFRTDGSRTHHYCDTPFFVPVQLVVREAPFKDARVEERPPQANTVQIGASVVFMPQPHPFALARVNQYQGGGRNLQLTVRADEGPALAVTPLPPALCRDTGDSQYGIWYTMEHAAQLSGCSVAALGKFTTAVVFMPGRVNVGLGLRDPRDGSSLRGFARRNDYGAWEISELGLKLCSEYTRLFPGIVFAIERGRGGMYDAHDAGGTAVLHSAKEWLKSQDHHKAPVLPSGMRLLSSQAINMAVRAVQEARALVAQQGKMQRVLHMIAPENVVAASSAWVRDLPVMTQIHPRLAPLHWGVLDLGMRVVNIVDDTIVPFGAAGTVIGVHGTSLTVMFDEPFWGGRELSGLCPDFRGAVVERHHVLLLPFLKLPQQTSLAAQPQLLQQPQAQPILIQRNPAAQTQRLATPQKQLRSSAPAQPLNWQQQLQQRPAAPASPAAAPAPSQQPQQATPQKINFKRPAASPQQPQANLTWQQTQTQAQPQQPQQQQQKQHSQQRQQGHPISVVRRSVSPTTQQPAASPAFQQPPAQPALAPAVQQLFASVANAAPAANAPVPVQVPIAAAPVSSEGQSTDMTWQQIELIVSKLQIS